MEMKKMFFPSRSFDKKIKNKGAACDEGKWRPAKINNTALLLT